jgi:hypothetical protein
MRKLFRKLFPKAAYVKCLEARIRDYENAYVPIILKGGPCNGQRLIGKLLPEAIEVPIVAESKMLTAHWSADGTTYQPFQWPVPIKAKYKRAEVIYNVHEE